MNLPARESLVLGSGRQLDLIDVDEAGVPSSAYAANEGMARFTAERIFSTNPRIYRAIVNLLARSVPYREISEICGVSVNTVCAVCHREGTPVETIRERIGRLGLDVAQLTLEAIRDLLADPEWRKVASARDLAIIHGIAFTNAQLALGGATSRPEVVDGSSQPSSQDYLDLIAKATPATDSGGGKFGQKERVPGVLDVAAEAVPSEPSK